ncbi:MAG: sensor histidine kinase [Thermomicrobiales bacterium]
MSPAGGPREPDWASGVRIPVTPAGERPEMPRRETPTPGFPAAQPPLALPPGPIRARRGWRKQPEPPPWWPADEPWPPKRKPDGKTGFLRKVGCFFGGGLALITAISLITIYLGQGGPLTVLALLGLIAVVFWMGRALRRAAVPIAEVMSAADRVASGDYTVRVPIRTQDRGEVGRLVRTFNNMTAKLETEEAQRRALFADVAHELRTPLAVIRGNVEGMLDGVYPRDDERLQTLLDESEIVARLLDDLRTLSLADAGALSLHPEPADLAELVDDLMTAFEPRAETAGVRLTAAVAPLGPVTLDPVRIRQALENLLANALRHTPRGGEVRLDVRPERGDIRFTVRDTGTGIPPEQLPHIFDRFWKSADSGGSGLGLAICRGLVEAHGGRIGAESEPGLGTTVWFTIPAR